MFRFIWCSIVSNSKKSDTFQVSGNKGLGHKNQKNIEVRPNENMSFEIRIICKITFEYAGKGDPKSCCQGTVNGK